MSKFILEISQQRNFNSFVKADDIRKRANDLNEEFGSIVQFLKFSLIADLRCLRTIDKKGFQNGLPTIEESEIQRDGVKPFENF
ncbi:uncharacterized protein OCT59_021596 [Rhizophagus irregularis]|uniref:Uncharacterized protein n=2 Tax=Rhizophagus irregularis TaxID=588596 RepID=A0A015LV11_RHIIW|nr:hypothetical protein GLOIN_2v1783761 [Rhizophagus irregularis DAOM 181602=DAOM 197198]EXX58488.1 hypothetical protein RirG_197510 [Rhizophagus irregularis DAOM 197198w]UZO28053.1 hypothetical protein OCT59_021596 [Rhizophagus irregularis]POG63713.1 hypothetical protein GLOIN_2v1783761 [Rhizophagus irregularis DAOM 181602=DAOM 197198]CAG8520383.1 9795_t:CDS:2 [Rhizophagus irregularis]GBC16107.1 hypothetical protein GLOIN_2v1783761 [Rhizophagus irregularis DAOM 181602=DAOM 197198]|eukprot:XP_025170579.1 hypothetical protein GLOIN_2v1783761 [Rhizophagus irregularis DAOM 181602=DAOM 197198]